MTAYLLERYEDEWSGAEGNRLIRESDGKELMSDGWVADAPEDATLDRAYSVLVDELNRLAEEGAADRLYVEQNT